MAFKGRFWRKKDGTESFMYNLLSLLTFGGIPIADYIHSRSIGEVPSVKEQVKQETSNGGFFQKLFGNDYVSNWLASSTGSELTDAQKQANAFNAEQAQLQRDFELEMSSTQYQRQPAN